MHIHGRDHAEVAFCQTANRRDDIVDDGVIKTARVSRTAAESRRPLTQRGDISPASGLALGRVERARSNGTLNYMRTFKLPHAVAERVEDEHIVIHGPDLNRDGTTAAGRRPSARRLRRSCPWRRHVSAPAPRSAPTVRGSLADVTGELPAGALPARAPSRGGALPRGGTPPGGRGHDRGTLRLTLSRPLPALSPGEMIFSRGRRFSGKRLVLRGVDEDLPGPPARTSFSRSPYLGRSFPRHRLNTVTQGAGGVSTARAAGRLASCAPC